MLTPSSAILGLAGINDGFHLMNHLLQNPKLIHAISKMMLLWKYNNINQSYKTSISS